MHTLDEACHSGSGEYASRCSSMRRQVVVAVVIVLSRYSPTRWVDILSAHPRAQLLPLGECTRTWDSPLSESKIALADGSQPEKLELRLKHKKIRTRKTVSRVGSRTLERTQPTRWEPPSSSPQGGATLPSVPDVQVGAI